MAKYKMVFHGFVGDEGPDKGPLSQEKEYDQYPVIPRVGEGVITGFGSLSAASFWRVRAVRHLIREDDPAEAVIVDLIPADH
jgi:hypothetical protein